MLVTWSKVVQGCVKSAGDCREEERVVESGSFTTGMCRTIMSKSEFAFMLGVPLKTLQKWEQGNRKPSGPAAALLRIADNSPDAFRKALA